LLSIARFKALTSLGRRREEQLEEGSMETLVDDADTPEQSVLHSDRSMQLRNCIAQLSPDHREVIDLVYYHDKPVDEIAKILNLPRNTVKTRMFYARKHLARLLTFHGDLPSVLTAARSPVSERRSCMSTVARICFPLCFKTLIGGTLISGARAAAVLSFPAFVASFPGRWE
jgi:predicted DNA-binding protein (UPF0251 family)